MHPHHTHTHQRETAMAPTPEDPAADDSEPFSPSIFLDLPPTPHPGDDGKDSMIDLHFIRRLLMEDDDVQFQYADHHALLQAAEEPFAQILAGSAGSSVSGSATADTTAIYYPDGTGFHFHQQTAGPTSTTGDDGVVTMDMLNRAFLKGMEEANKFLPVVASSTHTSLLCRDYASKHRVLDGIGVPLFVQESSGNNRRGRGCHHHHDDDGDDDLELEAEAEADTRSAKLIAPELEESGEVADGVFLRGYEVALEKMNGLSTNVSGAMSRQGQGRQQRSSGNEAIDLRTLLVHCAEAVSTGNRPGATELLRQIRQRSSPRGDASQRLAHCFAQGLELRLAGTGAKPKRAPAGVHLLKAYLLSMQVCCFRMVAFKSCHMAISKAVAGRKKVHIVDYGVDHGFHWLLLLGAWATRVGGPPEVRITGIDFPQPGFRSATRTEGAGRRLSDFARQCGVPFKFRSIVATKWEMIFAEDLEIEPDEVLVVSGLFYFGKLMDDEGVDGDCPSPRDMVLGNISRMRPEVFVLYVDNSSHNAPFFATRFREALFYYSALFDMMDATTPRDSDDRVLVERELLGRCALNVITCEGSERVERPETYRQWQVRCSRAGLRQLPLDPSTVKCLSDLVKEGYHKDFVIDVDQQWLLQGWKGRILYAMSTWAADR